MKKIIITTADNTNQDTYQYICKKFEEIYGEAEFTQIIDNSIVGGFIADIDGEIYDLSVLSQLNKMEKQISG